jgi:hypothetical protein
MNIYKKEDDRVVVKYCGDHNREIYIRYDNKKIIHIGCFSGTKEEAIKRIENNYYGTKKKDYIDKVNLCFKLANPSILRFPFLIQLSPQFKALLGIVSIITAIIFSLIATIALFMDGYFPIETGQLILEKNSNNVLFIIYVLGGISTIYWISRFLSKNITITRLY